MSDVIGAGSGPVASVALVVVSTLDGATRADGYELARHWVSLLSHGDRGWVGTLNLATCGAVLLLASVAIHRRSRLLGTGPGVAAAVAVFATTLVVAAAFPMDPTPSYPPGAVVPELMSVPARIHAVAGVLAVGATAGMCLAGRAALHQLGRDRAARVSGWCATACAGMISACSVLAALSPSRSWEAAGAGAFQRGVVVVGAAWISWYWWSVLRTRPADEPVVDVRPVAPPTRGARDVVRGGR